MVSNEVPGYFVSLLIFFLSAEVAVHFSSNVRCKEYANAQLEGLRLDSISLFGDVVASFCFATFPFVSEYALPNFILTTTEIIKASRKHP